MGDLDGIFLCLLEFIELEKGIERVIGGGVGVLLRIGVFLLVSGVLELMRCV